jgi:hypothetical protein
MHEKPTKARVATAPFFDAFRWSYDSFGVNRSGQRIATLNGMPSYFSEPNRMHPIRNAEKDAIGELLAAAAPMFHLLVRQLAGDTVTPDEIRKVIDPLLTVEVNAEDVEYFRKARVPK